MSILLTGNKGFIGSGLECDEGIDLKNGSDIMTYESKRHFDVVIHTAALTSVTESMQSPKDYVRANILGTVNLLKQHPEAHFIYLSTAGVYGEGLDHTVNSPLKPDSVYASTKLAGEYMVRNLARSWCILRLTNVIGEGERGEPNVYQIFKMAEVLPIYGDGLQTRDFVSVETVRREIMAAQFKQGIFNVGSGVSITVLEVARSFNKPMKFLPARPGEIRNFGIKLDA